MRIQLERILAAYARKGGDIVASKIKKVAIRAERVTPPSSYGKNR